MGTDIFNLVILIVAVSLILFIIRQKKFSKKLDTIIIIAGAASILIVNKSFLWISVFILVIVYFLISSFTQRSAD